MNDQPKNFNTSAPLAAFACVLCIRMKDAPVIGQLKTGGLRALGFDAQGVLRLSLVQSGLLGLAAGLLALPVGIGLAALLIFVINRRSFGWSMELTLDLGTLLAGVVLALVAALLAGAYPARRAAAAPPAAALRAD